MKGAWFILFMILFFCSEAEGLSQVDNRQDKRIIFNGVVRDAETSIPLPNSQIFINKAFVTVSSDDGTFVIRANRGDTVVFRLLGYRPEQFYVNDTITGREFIAGIYMRSDTLSIGEVIILPRLANLKNEIFKSPSPPSQEMENAKYNMAISAYQGKMAVSQLGSPSSNYAVLHEQQRTYAFEKGTIPSDRIVGLNPFMLLPAAYLLIHGLPQKPQSMKSDLTQQELDQIQKRYFESINNK